MLKTLAQSLLTTALECWVVGHRGAAAVAPENTLPSICAARDAGALMIEFDVQQSADDALFVFHDHTLARFGGEPLGGEPLGGEPLGGEPLVASALPWEVLSQKSVGTIHGQAVGMPLLDDVFATLQRSVFYNVELKTDTVHFPGIEEKLVALIAQHGLAERVLVSSFYHQSLREIRRWSADLALGLLLSQEQAQGFTAPADIVRYARDYDCCALHPDFRLLRQWPELVLTCHDANLRVFPWTADDPRDWRMLVEDLHVDGIITNDPGKLYAWLLTRANSLSGGNL
jgi:glycerophosphoryl diester phosphodiesterase